jgi:tetrahydromethanopterin S-methyltransferase subunit A
MDWPVVEGRYKVGNPKSPVAVCTMASVNLELPMDKIAISGKTVTENLGIEKIIKNIVSNPNIRFLILCGNISKGHWVGQAIISLIKNGVDSEKKIIGAKGGMPVLKNLTMKEIETFRKQIEPVDLIGETNPKKILEAVNTYFNKNPGPYTDMVGIKTIKPIPAWHNEKEWIHDPNGFFTIQLDGENIIVEHYSNDKKIQNKIIGKKAEEIFHTIIRMGLISRHDHAAYLGKELAKAEIALKNKLNYEQDKELSLIKK